METNRVNPITNEIWEKLEKEPPAGNAFNARRICPEICDKVFAALDSKRKRHVLVLLDTEDEEFEDRQSRGIQARTIELETDSSPSSRYIDITCETKEGAVALDFIGSEIAEKLNSHSEDARREISAILARWRRFWGQIPRTVLTKNQQIGLFAELWFLKQWLIPAVGAMAALEQWRGPYGSRHDFQRQGLCVEVKATTSTRGRIHRINGIEQLEAPDEGELFLFSLRLTEERSSEHSLPMLVVEISALLDDLPEAIDLFEQSLFQAGYMRAHEPDYAQTKIRVVDGLLFRVDGEFPKIINSSFTGGRPEGVESLEYDININTAITPPIATNPTSEILI